MITVSSKESDMSIIPFLKWAGGKRWLVYAYQDLFNISFERYIEPFVGSGSVFFHVNPQQAILSDKNKRLMDVYRAIKSNWQAVQNNLAVHSRHHSRDYYYQIRSTVLEDDYEKAAQFIYLNRTCWNGLYRVNKNGQFNVPIGTKDKVILDTDNFEGVSKKLECTELLDGDFEAVIDIAQEGDFLFVDPPYTAKHNKNGFLKYNESIFSWDDQVRLSESVKRAKDRGVKIILTNADHESVINLYSLDFDTSALPRVSKLAGKSQFRGKVTELLVLGNY